MVPVVRAAVLALACALASAPARADDQASRAHAAYDRGTAAYAKGDYATAAREYATADATLPSPVALQAALDAVILADDPVLGTELIERSSRAPVEGALANLVAKARARFKGRTGRVKVTCESAPCLFAIDGVAMNATTPIIVRVGAHTITFANNEQRFIDVRPDETTAVSPAPSPAPTPSLAPTPAPTPPPSLAPTPTHPPAPAPDTGGISRAWFFVGAGVTAVLGGVTIWSGIDATNKHNSFTDAGCSSAPFPRCTQLQSDGTSAQTRTNVLLGVTAALGVATVAVGLFAVRWSDAVLSVGLLGGAPAAALRVELR